MNSADAPNRHREPHARPQPDWDPMAPAVLHDPLAAYDRMRHTMPVAYSLRWGWSVFRHHDVRHILLNPEGFSNAVSRHLAVPNGMNPPEHTHYRRLVESCFLPERLARFEPSCRAKAAGLIRGLLRRGHIEFMKEAAFPFAAWAQATYLGWPASLQNRLIRWTQTQQEATRSGDRRSLLQLGMRFQQMVVGLLENRPHRAASDPSDDLTSWLLQQTVHGRLLSYEELTSLLRNFTLGEIGTLSAALGIVVHFLATHSDLQNHLRSRPSDLSYAIEEILRIHGPLHISRRISTRPVVLGGRPIGAAERITVVWIAANRDESVFPHPDEFRFGRNLESSLLWGAGIHVCPGALLARLQIRLFLEELLSQSRELALDSSRHVAQAVFPAGGFASLPLTLR